MVWRPENDNEAGAKELALCSREEDFKLFDMLPKELRQLIANSPLLYDTSEINEIYQCEGLAYTLWRVRDSNRKHVDLLYKYYNSGCREEPDDDDCYN